jgi:hypothetical protein
VHFFRSRLLRSCSCDCGISTSMQRMSSPLLLAALVLPIFLPSSAALCQSVPLSPSSFVHVLAHPSEGPHRPSFGPLDVHSPAFTPVPNSACHVLLTQTRLMCCVVMFSFYTVPQGTARTCIIAVMSRCCTYERPAGGFAGADEMYAAPCPSRNNKIAHLWYHPAFESRLILNLVDWLNHCSWMSGSTSEIRWKACKLAICHVLFAHPPRVSYQYCAEKQVVSVSVLCKETTSFFAQY